MENLSLELLAPHRWFWILLLIPALCLAFWTYYRLLAPLSRPARISLWVLRSLAFLLVLFALWQPVLTVVIRDHGKPSLAVLVDRSASNLLPGGPEAEGKPRGAEVEALVPRLADELRRTYRLQWYGFNESLRSIRPDSLPGPAGATGLGSALEGTIARTGNAPISGIVVVSDGVNTIGRDPVRAAETSPVPVFTVAVGPRHTPRDLELRRVETNPTAWKGEPLPLRVGLSAEGLTGKTARIEVREDGELRQTTDVQVLGGQGLEQEVKFSLAPRQPGLRLFEVTATVDGDSVPANNRRLVAVNVLEKKTKVLCVSDAIDWDFGFLRRAFDADTTLAYTYLTQDRPGSFRADGDRAVSRLPASAGELAPFAAVVLNYTGRGLPTSFLERLGGFVQGGGGLLLLGGPESLSGLPAGFTSALSASLEPEPRGRDATSALVLTGDGMRHPALQLRDNPAEAAQWIAQLPPLFRTAGRLVPRGGAQSLFEWAGKGSAHPSAFTAGFVGRGKSAWWHARGEWRWRLLAAGVNQPADAHSQILLGMTRWLAEPLSRDRFQTKPARQVVQAGEAVAWNSNLWNEAYEPIKDARVTVEVRASNDSAASSVRSLELSAGNDVGSYEGTSGVLPPGEYRYRSVARDAGGRSLGESSGRFWVESMGPEFSRSSSDRETLAEIARRSHGAAFEASGLSALANAIPRTIRRVGAPREFELWNSWVLFVLFVLVLSTEWFLRRRRGLA